MADEHDQSDNELDGIRDDEAKQLLAAADAPPDQPEKPDVVDKDWQAEAEKWRGLSRKNEKSFKDTAAKLKQYEDANKTELQRLQEERDSGMTRAEKAEAALKRRELAEQFAPEHATVAQIKAVAKRLSGADDDELEADAKELFELIAPEPKAAPKVAGARPKERLKGGSEPDEAPEVTDPRKLADLIPRRR
jgi:hypothetical protein